MPLTSILPELRKARDAGYAVALFDVFDALAAEGVFAALEEKRSPGIAAIYSSAMDGPAAEAFSAFLIRMAERASVPVSVMLDHGRDLEQCRKALNWGFTDVMFDGSALDFDRNVAVSRRVVKEARGFGAGVEVELGTIGSGRDYQDYGARGRGFTDPDQAELFLRRTGADILAVAVGTAHGAYRGKPRLDYARIEEIRRRVDAPLVLHGGSGLSASQFQAAIRRGIAKVNVATNLVKSAGEAMAAAARRDKASYFALTRTLRESYRTEGSRYLQIFGSAGRG